MNFNGGAGFIGTGTLVGPIDIDGDLKVDGDIEATGDVKGATGHITGTLTTANFTATNDVVIQGDTSVQALTGDTVSLASMPIVVSTAVQTLPSGSANLDIQWDTYSSGQSHPYPVTALTPIASNTEQGVNVTGNYSISIAVVIVTAGGFTGTIQIITTRSAVLIAPPQNLTVTGNGTYEVSYTTSRWFQDGESFKTSIAMSGNAPADFSVGSYLSVVRVS